MSAQLRVVEELLAAGLHRTGELALSVRHSVLAEGPAVSEDLAAAWDVAGVGFLLDRVFAFAGVCGLFDAFGRRLRDRRPVLVHSSLLRFLGQVSEQGYGQLYF